MNELLIRFGFDALRSAVVLALALAALVVVRAPAARRVLLATALAGVLVMPIVSAITPRASVPVAVPSMMMNVHPRAERDAVVEGVAVEAPAAIVVTPARLSIDWSPIVVAIWALGTLLAASRIVVGLWRVRGLVRRSRAADWSRVIAGRRIDVRIADVAAPAVTGIFRPVVLIPAENWSDERRRAVLLHELAHVSQRDCALQLVAQLACAMHWFNPLVWLAARQLRVERELAADDSVLAAGVRATSYATDLLSIAAADDLPANALGMGARTHLATRIAAIVADRARGTSSIRRLGVVATTSLVALGAACAGPKTTGSGTVTSGPSMTGNQDSPKNVELRQIVDEEYKQLLANSKAKAAVIVVIDPSTGAILADAGASNTAYVTGSTLKPFVLASALDAGVVSPSDTFDCGQGDFTYAGKTVHDYAKHGVLSVSEMLAVSTNIGFTKLFDKMGAATTEKGLEAFHFAPPALKDHDYPSAMVAIGEVTTATPIDLARAYVPLANGGEYIRDGGGRERVMKAETVAALRPMLENVVTSARGTGHAAAVNGVRVAGKTGTATWDLPGGGEGTWASFVGFVPSNAPRYVILVGADMPDTAKDTSGGAIAAPVFSRIATRLLALK